MKEIKLLGKQLGIFLLIILFSTLLLSILEYVSLLSPKINHILLVIIILTTTFILGINSGKKAESKGYFAGIKMGGLCILSLLFLNTIFCGLHVQGISILYYLSIILLCIIGAMIGINKKKK